MNTTEYLLSCLIEECAEVIQRATKCQRFGLSEVQPGQELDNQERLSFEVADLHGTLELLAQEGIGLTLPSEAAQKKIQKVRQFMDYSREQGCLLK